MESHVEEDNTDNTDDVLVMLRETVGLYEAYSSF